MKERPIIFSGPMVRALLDGTKTQTRRAVKPHPEWMEPNVEWQQGNGHSGPGWYAHDTDYPEEGALFYGCPYGQPGDRLYVKETFYAWGRWETRFNAKKGRDEWHFVDMTVESGRQYLFAADNDNYSANLGANQGRGVYPAWWKRPAIFMPQAASRISLEVPNVRVERLQEITFVEAAAEGLRYSADRLDRWSSNASEWHAMPQQAYRALWEQINGPGSWEANPWVWVIEFRRLA